MSIGIYKITNKKNGKIYIGQSINIERRWKEHKKNAITGNEPSRLYDAMRKDGIELFEIEIIETIKEYKNKSELHYTLDLLEAKHIRENDAENSKIGYNTKPKGFIISVDNKFATNMEDYNNTIEPSERFNNMVERFRIQIQEGLKRKQEIDKENELSKK